MILKYNDIMNSIQVDEKMKNRILNNINTQSVSATKPFYQRKKRGYFSLVAACFVLVGGFNLGQNIPISLNDAPLPFMSYEENLNDIMLFNNIDDLSGYLGFSMVSLNYLPFEYDYENYTSYWGDIGEIMYKTDESEKLAVLRKSKGFEDNSGDYNEYSEVKDIVKNGLKYILKGSEKGKYNILLWNDSSFSYSLVLKNSVTEREMLKIINNLK